MTRWFTVPHRTELCARLLALPELPEQARMTTRPSVDVQKPVTVLSWQAAADRILRRSA